ncbi:flagellar hook-associated family protein [Hyphomicrobium sp. LHD-15]|uniref:flagellar hook-associated family protein n=1 Tax=Hyphomicrobium sp. LHD-15 TaxID=3072142 RepID=UPI00280D470F|nr:flagellar hook-associated family protein [Hyphomicrobium sp. LHD-15]MDQ8699060.1 flagellar hook-associated family protein [Hyphomicrobium sp. LHD-15]
MKTTTVSTAALTNATRETRTNLQVKLAEGQKEATTGRLADVGLSLGYLTQRTVSLRQDLDRLNTFKDTNAVASSRLELTQTTLEGVGEAAQEFLQTLVAARASRSSDNVAITDAKQKLTSFNAAMNTAVNGAHIFAGVNTDVKPLTDYYGTPTSAARTAMADAFVNEFGVAQSQSGVESISGAQMSAFLDGAFNDLFDTANWTANWSAASEQNITSRINSNERIATSTNANEAAFRSIAAAYTMISDIGLEELNEEAYQTVLDKAIAVVGQAVGDLTQVRAGLGTSEERIAAANERIEIQVTIMNEHITTLEGVDPYEATANVNALLTQIETAYALTARLQNLSLINHI